MAENVAGKVFSHPSLVMLQKTHEPRGLDIFNNPAAAKEGDSNVELVNASNPAAETPTEVFVVLPSEKTEQVIYQMYIINNFPKS